MSMDKRDVFCTCFPMKVWVENYGELNSCKQCFLSIPDQEAVYNAFKNVEPMRYVGKQGIGQERGLIRAIVGEQRYRAGVTSLIQRYGTEALSSTIQNLVNDGVFTSLLTAKKLVPGSSVDKQMEKRSACDETSDQTPAMEGIWEFQTARVEPSYEENHWEPGIPTEDRPVSVESQLDAMVAGPCRDDSIAPADQDAEPAAELEKVVDEEVIWDMTPAQVIEEAPSYELDPYRLDSVAQQEEQAMDLKVMEEEKVHDGDHHGVSAGDELQYDTIKSRDSADNQQPHYELNLPDERDNLRSFSYVYDDEEDAVKLHFGSQYELMMQLQRYIERACYAYGRREIPTTLARNSWDCDEAVTLERWMREFLGRIDSFDTKLSVKSLQSLFQRLCAVQTVNLDRTRLTLVEIDQFLSDAHTLMEVLNVSGYTELIKKLEVDIKELLHIFDAANCSFRYKREAKMKCIQSQRAMLDRLEKEITAEVKDDIEKNQRAYRYEIRAALQKIAARFETDIASGDE
ncbi:hypothetical protein FLONG3_3921 [Fusarium longipes]|uniref:Ubiquinol-cytochrome-c reductase cytochrome c1 n=1 Tax=Fusarium longipes TaxID=694270 RepID=A0A395SZP5_9HYPO|nr:hypothetical protein FLONG3_3921 [Fusarium longipes]